MVRKYLFIMNLCHLFPYYLYLIYYTLNIFHSCFLFILVGKTALHWAAAVNYIDAVQLLLNHGAQRDAQDNKEETPLFLAAREGSYAAVKLLLENMANRDITDHVESLPRDIAFERQHRDIVKLLEEYVPPSPQMNIPTNGLMGSPGIMPSNGGNCSMRPKGKKRTKCNTIAGLPLKEGDGVGQDPSVRRKPSLKRRKEPPPMLNSVILSPVNSLESPRTTSYLEGTPPPLEPIYNGMSHPNLLSIDNNCTMNSEQSPTYEDCVNAVSQIYGVMGMDALNMGLGNFANGMMSNQNSQQQNMKPNHPRQNSMPSSMSQILTVPTSHSYTMSSSLTKQRPSLPTSPTHMAAMRAAHQQKTAQMQSHPNTYDYPPMTDLHHMLTAPKHSGANQPTMQMSYSQYHYPTPPSQHSQPETSPQSYLLGPETYLTPSPESPGQWSSSSPHSAQSDWSEGISSPMGPTTNIHPNMSVSEQQKTQQVQQSHLNPEAVFI